MEKRRMLLIGGMVFFLISIVCSTGSYASGRAEEHDGFYLRFQLGYASTESKGTGYSSLPDLEVSGGGTIFRLDVGGAVQENLILFATFGGISTKDPDIKFGSLSATADDTTSSISDVGFGVTYYLMPSNFYVGGSLNIAQNEIEFGNSQKGSSDSGFGLYVNVGKEWWISDNWGLGVGGYGYFGSVPDKGEGTIKNQSFGLFFSATYN